MIEEYRANIIELRNSMLEQVNADSDNHYVRPSGDTLVAVDDLNAARKKLLSLLQTENYFDADLVLIHFQTGDWIEEKSILLSRLGRHKQALYVYTEGMPERALLYCEQVAHRCPEVYEYLLGRIDNN